MKNKVFASILAAFVCVCLITCNNPIMKEWWDGGNAASVVGAEIYTVHFESNLGEPAPEDLLIAKGSKIGEPPPMTRDSYAFGGWYIDNDTFEYQWNFDQFPIDPEDDADKDGIVTLYAQWIPNTSTYTVEFDNNGESPTPPLQHVTGGGKLIEPAAGKNGTLGFAGWYTDETFTTEWNFGDPVNKNMTLYAKWDPAISSFTVTFENNGGLPIPDPQIVTEGRKLIEPAAGTKPDNGFAGWYEDDGTFAKPWDFTKPVTKDMPLYAHWIPGKKTYTIDFRSNGGSPTPDTQTVTEGRKLIEPAAGTKPADGESPGGYGFGGWYPTASFSGTPYDFSTPVNGNMTLYAQWIPGKKTYTVDFKSNGGRTPEPPDQIVVDNGKLIEPAAGTKGKFGFAGWYKTASFSGTPYDFSTGVTGNMTLYAKWDPAPCTVTFVAEGGDPVPDKQTLAGGQNIKEPPLMTRDGYAFDGWYTNQYFDGSSWDFTQPIIDDMSLYAKWGEIKWTVTFEKNGGSVQPPPQTVTENGKLIEPAVGTNGTSGFAGWYEDDEFTKPWDFTKPVTKNMELFAKWDMGIPTYTVTFDNNGGSPTPVPQTVTENGKLIEPAAGINGTLAFAGWYEDNETFAKPWDFTKPVTKTMTLYAKWEPPPPPNYTVTFIANGGNPAPEIQNLAEGQNIREPDALTRVGYAFGGWFTEENLSGVPLDFSTDDSKIAKNMILYAKWIPNFYTVTFVPDGGTPAPVVQKIPYGGKIDVPPLMTQEGMGFGGWYKSTDFSKPIQQWNFLTDTVTGNVTLYAYWGEGQYKVKFNLDNGNQPLEYRVVYNAKVIRPPDPAKDADGDGKDGYVFKGWYTTADKNNKTLFDFDKPVTTPAPGTSENPAEINVYARYVFHNPMMAWIPGGTFSMGGLSGAGATTRPAHNVTVSGFYMFKAEITQYAFHSVQWWKKNGNLNPYYFDNTTEATGVWAFNPSRAKGMYRPVESITWYDAVYFCNLVTEYENTVSRKGIDPFELPYKITNIRHENGTLGVPQSVPPDQWFELLEEASYSQVGGVNESIVSATVELNPKLDPNDSRYDPEAVGYHLPTEAQWEYAARGGNGSPGDYKWAGSNTANDVSWYGGGGGNTTQTQSWGQKAPNQFGIYDMSGNVCEWCWDWYDKGYYTVSPATDPIGPAGSPTNERTRRGGSIRHTADNCRTQVRDSWEPGKTDNWNIGFRLVRSGEE